MTAENCSSPFIETVYVINSCKKDDQNNDNAIDTNEEFNRLPAKFARHDQVKSFSTYYKPQFYPCNICDKIFTRACDLINHDDYDHENIPRDVHCDVCGKLVISEDRLILHKRKFHATKVYPCNICLKKFVSAKSLATHYQVHCQLFICDYCEKSFHSKNTLLAHIKKHILNQTFVCDECGKVFTSKAGLNVHKRTHSLVKLFRCDKCDFGAKHQSGIYIHMLTRHKDAEVSVCELCGRSFKNKMRLNEHLKRKHGTPKRFPCDQCDSSFKQMYQLRCHYRKHTGEKPYVCEACGKRFSRSDGLKDHKRIHHDKFELT